MLKKILTWLLYSTYFFLLSTAITSFVFISVAQSTIFDPVFYRDFLVKYDVYDTFRIKFIKSMSLNFEQEPSRLFKFESAAGAIITPVYFQTQADALLFESFGFVRGERDSFEPRLDLTPIKSNAIDLGVDYFSDTIAPNPQDPSRAAILEAKKKELEGAIPDSVDKKLLFEKYPQTKAIIGGIEGTLASVRDVYLLLGNLALASLAATIILTALLLAVLRDLHEFFQKLSAPITLAGGSLIFTALTSPPAVARVLDSQLSGQSIDPTVLGLLTSLAQELVGSMAGKIFLWGIAFVLLGALFFVLSHFVFVKKPQQQDTPAPLPQKQGQSATQPQESMQQPQQTTQLQPQKPQSRPFQQSPPSKSNSSKTPQGNTNPQNNQKSSTQPKQSKPP
ncbi:hypothetical protein FJZ26_01770 [Candidatus Parvarchaeota archaeon]|nr:hypothetical protein [Candidatus Parvarchaeota archaeon]